MPPPRLIIGIGLPGGARSRSTGRAGGENRVSRHLDRLAGFPGWARRSVGGAGGPVLAPEIGVDGGLAVDPFPEFVPPTSPRSPPGDWTLAVARTAGAGSGRFSGGWLVLVADPGQEADGAPAGIQSALGCGPCRRRWRHRGRPGLAWRCYPATFGDPLDPTALEPVEPVLESLDLYTHLCLPCPHHSY